MKKTLAGLCLVLLNGFAHAEHGLENIIVEKYYVSNAADSIGSIGRLPAGSVTYRIYVDLLPGYKFQAAYGVPGHQLKLATTTSFFNNEDRGSITPTYTKTQAAQNTVMLDSWLSSGAVCSGNFGILKTEDNASGGANVVNANGILQNADPEAGIPLTSKDGFYAGTPEAVTTVGLSAGELSIFNATSQAGNLFTTANASWASLNGSVGPTATNKVLIAQMTTNGIFSFELNIQIGTPLGGVQNYVARNPVGNEIKLASLIYSSVKLNVKAFIQGYYAGAHKMNPVLSIQNVPGATAAQVDTVIVELRSVSDFSLVDSYKAILDTGGNVSGNPALAAVGTLYYIGLRHRNALFTVSANPIMLTKVTNYNFTLTASSAFGANQTDVLNEGIWSMYSGDVSQDEYIATDDVTIVDNDNLVGLSGSYLATDIGGDSYCGTDDVTLTDNNNLTGISSMHP